MQFTKNIPFQGAEVPVDVVSDRYIFDSEVLAAGAYTEQNFFVSKAAKSWAQANFEGDQSLVSEGRIFEVLGIYIYFEQVSAVKNISDASLVFNSGYYEWSTQGVLTDRDWMHQMIGSVDLYDAAGVVTPFQGDGAHANIRKYAISRFVPGGRSIEFRIVWPGSITLAQDTILKVRLYGYEEIPRAI